MTSWQPPQHAPAPPAATNRRWRRWLCRAMILIALISLSLGWMFGCTATIVPPAHVQQPARVFVLDHGYTSSIVLPDENEAGMIRYAYGDWNYYALTNRGIFDAIAALGWSTPATLGRKHLPGGMDRTTIEQNVFIGISHTYEIIVEHNRIAPLREKLDTLFEQNIDTLHVSRANDLSFVHHPRPYNLFYNSNHFTADALRQLGCDVNGPTILSNWKVAEVAE